MRLSPKAINSMSKSTGVNMKSFFLEENLKGRGDKKYSDPEIAKYYQIFKKACDDNGMRFSTCYIGNGEKDFYQYQDMWTNKKDCCDAIGNVKSFINTSQQIPWETRISMHLVKSQQKSLNKK